MPSIIEKDLGFLIPLKLEEPLFIKTDGELRILRLKNGDKIYQKDKNNDNLKLRLKKGDYLQKLDDLSFVILRSDLKFYKSSKDFLSSLLNKKIKLTKL